MSEVEGRKVSQEELGKILGVKRGKIDAVENRRGEGARPEVTTDMAKRLFHHTGALIAPFRFVFPTGKIDGANSECLLEEVEICEVAPSLEEVLNLSGNNYTSDDYRDAIALQKPVTGVSEEQDSTERLAGEGEMLPVQETVQQSIKDRLEVLFKAACQQGRTDEVQAWILKAIAECADKFFDETAINNALHEWNDSQEVITKDDLDSHSLLLGVSDTSNGEAALDFVKKKAGRAHRKAMLRKPKGERKEMEFQVEKKQVEPLLPGDEIVFHNEIAVVYEAHDEKGEIQWRVRKFPARGDK